MEELKDALLSPNIIVWIILVILLVVVLKFLKTAGKWFIMLVAVIFCLFVLHKVAPGVLDPLIDFVRGGWLGENRPDKPW